MAFRKGESGNPFGRPPGVSTKQTRLREQIGKAVPEILEALIESAKGGDTQASRLLLERCLPALKTVDAPAPIVLGVGLSESSAAVLQALAAGSLTPDQGASLASVLGALARVEETVTLAARVAALEEKHHEQLN